MGGGASRDREGVAEGVARVAGLEVQLFDGSIAIEYEVLLWFRINYYGS